MMFYILVICVCLAVPFLVLACASLVSWPLRAMAANMVCYRAAATAANLLFAVRTLPLFLALGLTLGLALPAFLRFEPRSTSEAMGAKLLLLAAAGATTLIVMAVRGLRLLRATARAEKVWRAGCEEHGVNLAGSQVPVYYVKEAAALLAVTGFLRPRIFVARHVARMLSPEELSAAVAHEMAHVSFFDNLKQFLLKITRLPRWLGGTASEDAAWAIVSEVAADEAALANGASAIDLASALVKMAALKAGALAGDQITASHLLPHGTGSALEMRIARLQSALEGELAGPKIKPAHKRWQMLGAIAMLGAAYVAAVSSLLPAIHDALEFLVR